MTRLSQITVVALMLVSICASASNFRSAKMEIEEMRWVFERYFKTFGVYPDSFQELMDKYSNVRHPDDPWDRKYRYSLERPSFCDKEMPYYLWTLGSDNEVGGEDTARDIANCNL